MRGGEALRTPPAVAPAAARAVHPLLLAAGLAAGPAVVLGIARFAYGLLLPGMRADLHWSFAQAGTINAANALGYLAGAMLTPRVTARLGRRPAFLGGMVVVVVALVATGLASGFGALLALRVVAGVAGALVFIGGMELAAWLGHGRSSIRAAVLLGVYVGGGGLGIVVSGMVVPPILALGGASGWRLGWLMLAALSLAGLMAARWASGRVEAPAMSRRGEGAGWPARRFVPSLIAYTLFGVGYISYITFVVALLVHQGLSRVVVGSFWVLLGLASLLSVPLWGRVLGRLRGGRGPALVLAVVAAGAALPLLGGGAAAAMASALVFGGAFLSVVTSFTAVARAALPAPQWGPAIAALTAVFALGQCAGPVLTGLLSDVAGGVGVGLGLSAAVLGLASLIAFAQAPPGDL